MGEEVVAAFFEQAEILLRVGFVQFQAGLDFRAAAVHLEGADGGDDDDGVRFQAGITAFQIPELFKTEVSAEAGFRDVVFGKGGSDLVRDDGTLSDGDICERSRMDENRLAFDGLHERRIEGFDHPGGHRAVDFQIGRRDGGAGFRIGDDDFADAFPQIRKIFRDGENGHDFGGDGDGEAGFHFEAVHLAALADGDVAEGLRTEVHDPFHLDAVGIDVEPFEIAFGELRVVVVAFMLHAGGEGDHGEIVRVGDAVDIAREA